MHHEGLSLSAKAEDQWFREFAAVLETGLASIQGVQGGTPGSSCLLESLAGFPNTEKEDFLAACNDRQKCIHKPCLCILPGGCLDGQGGWLISAGLYGFLKKFRSQCI